LKISYFWIIGCECSALNYPKMTLGTIDSSIRDCDWHKLLDGSSQQLWLIRDEGKVRFANCDHFVGTVLHNVVLWGQDRLAVHINLAKFKVIEWMHSKF